MNLGWMYCSGCRKHRLPADFQLGTSPSNRHHQPWCRRCRSNAYFEKKYGGPCLACGEYKRLWKWCRKCLDCTVGLRECRRCKSLLPPLTTFYGHQRVCKGCKKIRT